MDSRSEGISRFHLPNYGWIRKIPLQLLLLQTYENSPFANLSLQAQKLRTIPAPNIPNLLKIFPPRPTHTHTYKTYTYLQFHYSAKYPKIFLPHMSITALNTSTHYGWIRRKFFILILFTLIYCGLKSR